MFLRKNKSRIYRFGNNGNTNSLTINLDNVLFVVREKDSCETKFYFITGENKIITHDSVEESVEAHEDLFNAWKNK